jgi:DNA-binding NarL/FixJ family response regulator
LVVDDHALLRKGIRLLTSTESDMQLVAEASTGREAVQEFRTPRPDITLMDLQMPDMSGVEAMIAIRGEFPNAQVIVLTTYSGDSQVLRAS